MKQSAGKSEPWSGFISWYASNTANQRQARPQDSECESYEFEADKVIFGEDSIGQRIVHFSSVLWGTTITWVRSAQLEPRRFGLAWVCRQQSYGSASAIVSIVQMVTGQQEHGLLRACLQTAQVSEGSAPTLHQWHILELEHQDGSVESSSIKGTHWVLGLLSKN